jgi:hypothetical protein
MISWYLKGDVNEKSQPAFSKWDSSLVRVGWQDLNLQPSEQIVPWEKWTLLVLAFMLATPCSDDEYYGLLNK